MKKNYIYLIPLLLLNLWSHAQCNSCTVTNPVSSGSYTFVSGSTVCFTTDTTIGSATFEDNSKLCVASGVTLIIQNNIISTTGHNIEFNIGGTLQLDQSAFISANLKANIDENLIGKNGNNVSFNLQGNENEIINNGIIEFSGLTNNSGSINIINNNNLIDIGTNLNL